MESKMKSTRNPRENRITVFLLFLVIGFTSRFEQVVAQDVTRENAEKLIRKLGARDFHVRERASKEVVEIGRKSKTMRDALSRVLTNSDPEIVMRAANAIAQIDIATGVHVERLKAELNRLHKESEFWLILCRKMDSPQHDLRADAKNLEAEAEEWKRRGEREKFAGAASEAKSLRNRIAVLRKHWVVYEKKFSDTEEDIKQVKADLNSANVTSYWNQIAKTKMRRKRVLGRFAKPIGTEYDVVDEDGNVNGTLQIVPGVGAWYQPFGPKGALPITPIPVNLRGTQVYSGGQYVGRFAI